MIDRIRRWLGWGPPQEEPVPNKKSSAMYRLQSNAARSAVDRNRRPPQGGTGAGLKPSKKPLPAVPATDDETPDSGHGGIPPTKPNCS